MRFIQDDLLFYVFHYEFQPVRALATGQRYNLRLCH